MGWVAGEAGADHRRLRWWVHGLVLGAAFEHPGDEGNVNRLGLKGLSTSRRLGRSTPVEGTWSPPSRGNP